MDALIKHNAERGYTHYTVRGTHATFYAPAYAGFTTLNWYNRRGDWVTNEHMIGHIHELPDDARPTEVNA